METDWRKLVERGGEGQHRGGIEALFIAQPPGHLAQVRKVARRIGRRGGALAVEALQRRVQPLAGVARVGVLLKLLQVGWKMQGNLSAERIHESTRVMTDLSYETYLYPREVLQRHPETPCATIDYRRLTTDPKGAIEAAYAALGLDMTEAYRAFLAAEAARVRKHETEHRYSLAEFGLEDREIRHRLAPLFEAFQWDKDEPRSREAPTKENAHA